MKKSTKIIVICLAAAIVLTVAIIGTVFALRVSRTPHETETETTAETTTRAETQAETAADSAFAWEEDETFTTAETTTVPAATTTSTTAAATAATTTTTTAAATTAAATAAVTNAAAAARQPAAPTPPAVVPTQPALPGQPTQTQPAPPVTAAAETAKAGNGLYTLTVTGDGGIAEVRGGGAYRAGDMVTVEATTLLGYTFRQWASSDPSVLPGINLKTYTFQMPAQNIHLNAVSYNKPKVTVVAGNGVLSVSGGGNYEIGQTVTVSAQLEPGYTFVAWTADVAGFGSPAQTYTFKMPEKPITLTATAVKK